MPCPEEQALLSGIQKRMSTEPGGSGVSPATQAIRNITSLREIPSSRQYEMIWTTACIPVKTVIIKERIKGHPDINIPSLRAI
jgi:hypothetical protein